MVPECIVYNKRYIIFHTNDINTIQGTTPLHSTPLSKPPHIFHLNAPNPNHRILYLLMVLKQSISTRIYSN